MVPGAVLALLSGMLGGLAHGVTDPVLAPLLAMVAPAPVLCALRASRSSAEAFSLGCLWGLLLFGVGLLPVGPAVGWSYALAAALGCCLLSGGAGGVALRGAWRAVSGTGWRRATAGPLVVAAVWVGVEQVRSDLPLGLAFPWLTVGEPLAEAPRLLQLAEIAGPMALSFVAMLIAAALASPSRGTLGVAGLVLLGAVGWGQARLHSLDQAMEAGPRVAVVTEVAWGSDAGPFPDEATRLTKLAASRGADLVVWPETAVPESLDQAPQTRQALASVARQAGVDLVLGAYSGDEGSIRNTAIHLDPDGLERARFHKVCLVPLSEGLPDATRWPRLNALATHLVPAGFEPLAAGRRRGGSRLRPQPGKPAWRIGALICYEAQHATAARETVSLGADLLVAMANEERFTATTAIILTTRHARMRAVETRTPLIRAVSGAPSLLVDPLGQAHTLTDAVPVTVRRLEPTSRTSPWLRWGHGLALPAMLISLLALGAGIPTRSHAEGSSHHELQAR